MKRILLILLFLTSALAASAQVRSAGIFNSVRGIGLAMDFNDRQNSFWTARAWMDISGILQEQTKSPGFKMNASLNIAIRKWENKDCHFTFYAGPGVSGGYVMDLKQFGAMAALSADTGIRFDFDKKIYLDLYLMIEAGFHIKYDDTLNANVMTWYSNGIFQGFYPCLSIMFNF